MEWKSISHWFFLVYQGSYQRTALYQCMQLTEVYPCKSGCGYESVLSESKSVTRQNFFFFGGGNEQKLYDILKKQPGVLTRNSITGLFQLEGKGPHELSSLAQSSISYGIRLGCSEIHSVRFSKPSGLGMTWPPQEKFSHAWLPSWWKRISIRWEK